MSQYAFWPGKYIFYPIGNTSPVSLVQNLALEEDARILILGCGDPRSILFTLHATCTNPLSRSLDVTCCDWESAVLARNIILFSLLIDDDGTLSQISQIWNIFYNLYLDELSLSLLVLHSRRLLECSATIEAWHGSKYGHVLRICTVDTLDSIRKIWTRYVDTATMSARESKSYVKKFTAQVKDTHVNTGDRFSLHSLGPFITYGLSLVDDAFKQYWRIGAFNPDRPTDSAKASLPNPSFVFTSHSGDTFAVHHGTTPLGAFHLAEAYIACDSTRPTAPHSIEQMTISNLVQTSVTQFRRVCAAFVDIVRRPHQAKNVMIRFFAGDALSFCEALHYCDVTKDASTPFYTGQWRATSIQLSDDYVFPSTTFRAPTKFNVIETSNMVDHAGLLNLLVHCRPLMDISPSSTLYTETLFGSFKDNSSPLLKQACMDLEILSLLLGVMPAACVSKFSSTSNTHEIMLHEMYLAMDPWADSKGTIDFDFQERIAWRSMVLDPPNHQDSPDCLVAFPDTQKLVDVLLAIYLNMFNYESYLYDLPHYTRRSFVQLVCIAKRRITADWDAVFELFQERATKDLSVVLGNDLIHHLLCQFHVLGVHSAGILKPTHFFKASCMAADLPVFRSWKSIPSVVYIVLMIPRSAINQNKVILDRLGNPVFLVEVVSHPHGGGPYNAFDSVQMVCGTFSTVGDHEHREGLLQEDPRGPILGDSPFIAVFQTPSWVLSTPELKVGLSIFPTPSAVKLFRQSGSNPRHPRGYELFSSALTDERHVQVLTRRPNIRDERRKMGKFVRLNFRTTESPCAVAHVRPRGESPTLTFTVRAECFDANTKAALADGALVGISQRSPCTAELRIDDFKHPIHFTMPVDISQARLRIARKSAYVEVIAPSALLTVGSESSVGMFPLSRKGQNYTALDLHHLYLDRLPSIDSSNPETLEWILAHTTLAMSNREAHKNLFGSATTATVSKDPLDVLYNVKTSISSILLSSMGLGPAKDLHIEGPAKRTFVLIDESAGEFAIIIVTDVRLDLGAHCIIADAWVLPLAANVPPVIGRYLKSPIFAAVQIQTNSEDSRAWMRLFPALVERCRTWPHKPGCAYVNHGKPPLSLEIGTNPLCQCGMGIGGASAFKKVPAWQPFAPYVTRAAISSLFSVMFLERIGGLDRAGHIAAVCASCGKRGVKLLVCSKCKKTRYCSADCQRINWKMHKVECR